MTSSAPEPAAEPEGRRVAVLILTHGRPDNVPTWDTLKQSGWTGETYLVIDSEDASGDAYRARFGDDRVLVFDKASVPDVDTGDSALHRRGVVYARNAAWRIAADLGLTHFVVLDDDYNDFLYRYLDGTRIRSGQIRSLDRVVDALVEFLDVSGAVTVAFSQGGDHMGGAGGPIRKGVLRKAMNWFVFRTDRPVRFLGRQNEDVNAYVVSGAHGDLFFTVMALQVNQVQTQKSAGGMTGLYLDSGTFVKSFYSVMMAPSAVTVRTMGRIDRRYHHSVAWDRAVPRILSERHRKPRPDLDETAGAPA